MKVIDADLFAAILEALKGLARVFGVRR